MPARRSLNVLPTDFDPDNLPMVSSGNWPKHARELVVENRRRMVANLMLRGWGEIRISRELHVGPGVVQTDMVAIKVRWRQQQLDMVEEGAIRDLARLDAAIDFIWPSVEQGDQKAIDTLVKLINARGDILGYRGGVQVDVETFIRSIAEANGYDPDRALEFAQKISITLQR